VRWLLRHRPTIVAGEADDDLATLADVSWWVGCFIQRL
jgi:hypothetical protein